MLHNTLFKLRHFGGVAVKQRKLIHLSAHRPLETPHCVVINQTVKCLQSTEEFLTKHGNALAHGGGLSRHIVGASGDHQILPLLTVRTHAGQCGDRLVAHDEQ